MKKISNKIIINLLETITCPEILERTQKIAIQTNLKIPRGSQIPLVFCKECKLYQGIEIDNDILYVRCGYISGENRIANKGWNCVDDINKFHYFIIKEYDSQATSLCGHAKISNLKGEVFVDAQHEHRQNCKLCIAELKKTNPELFGDE